MKKIPFIIACMLALTSMAEEPKLIEDEIDFIVESTEEPTEVEFTVEVKVEEEIVIEEPTFSAYAEIPMAPPYSENYVVIQEPESEPEPTLPVVEEPPATPCPIEKTVTIYSSRGPVVTYGDTIYLTSVLTGFENCEVYYQWQCDKGAGYEDVSDGTAASYEFIANKETLSWNWKLIVYYQELGVTQ